MTTWPPRRTSTGRTPSTPRRATSPSTSSRPRRWWRASWPPRSERLIVDFHNFTAPEHFRGWEPHSEERAARARDDLALLAAAGRAGTGRQPLQRAGPAASRLPPDQRDPGPGRLPADGRPTRSPGGGGARRRQGAGRGRSPLRRADRPLQGPARAGQGPVGLPAALRPGGPPPPGGRILELRLSQGPPGLHRRAGVGRRRADHRRRVRRCAGGVFRRRRRLPVALGPRGVRGAAGRGDGGRCPRRGPPGRRRGRDRRRCRARCWPARTRRTWRRPCTASCTDATLREMLVAGGTAPSCRPSASTPWRPQLVAAVASVAGAPR